MIIKMQSEFAGFNAMSASPKLSVAQLEDDNSRFSLQVWRGWLREDSIGRLAVPLRVPGSGLFITYTLMETLNYSFAL